MKKEAKQNKHVKAEAKQINKKQKKKTKQNKIRVSGQQLAHARISLHAHARISLHAHNQARMCRQDYKFFPTFDTCAGTM